MKSSIILAVLAVVLLAGAGCGVLGDISSEPGQKVIKLYELTHNDLEPAAFVVLENSKVKDLFTREIGTYKKGDGPDLEMQIGNTYYLGDHDQEVGAYEGLYQVDETKTKGTFLMKPFLADPMSLIRFALELMEG